MRLFKAVGLVAVAFTLTASCSEKTRIDTSGHLDQADYLNMLNPDYVKPAAPVAPRPGEPPIPEMSITPPEISLQAKGGSEPPVPDLAEIIAAPKPPKIGTTKVVSVSVTDDVPLKDILIELARLADVDVEIDSSINGGITFRAKDRPFNEVIERISDMAGLRYSMRNNVLRIERDLPYVQTYPLDMLNIERSATGNIGVTSSGSSSGSGGTGGSSGGNSGSSSSNITAKSESDFWTKFNESVTQILNFSPTTLGSSAAAAPAAGAGSFFSLNRQAGTLTFSGTERQHQILQSFLKSIESSISSQVLIEAKIVEVTLNDTYQTGIDWNRLGSDSIQFTSDFNAVSAIDTALNPPAITVLKNDIFNSGIDLSLAVRLLEEFGTTRALSSPRLNATNNQQAVLSFVENLVYFDVKIEVTDAVVGSAGSQSAPAKVEVTSEPKNAPVGIVLTLQPSINQQSNEITLSVRPTLSRVTKFISDPGFEVGKAQAAAQLPPGSPVLSTLNATSSQIPQLEIRELDSILKVKSGQVMVIGGLLEDKVTSNDGKMPYVADVPYFGNLFKSVDRVNTKKELVILIRATIVPSTGNASHADQRLYEKFTTDPRPLQF